MFKIYFNTPFPYYYVDLTPILEFALFYEMLSLTWCKFVVFNLCEFENKSKENTTPKTKTKRKTDFWQGL